MKTALRRSGWLALLALTSWAKAAEVPVLTVAQYVAQLRAYDLQVRDLQTAPQHATEFYKTIPEKLLLQGPQGDISVPTGFLRDGIIRFQTAVPKAKPGILSRLSQRLQWMSQEAQAFELPGGADAATRVKLDAILARSEFRAVHGPTAWEVLRDKITAWIQRQLNKLNPHLPTFSDVGQIAIWVLIAAACSVLGVWLSRIAGQRLVERPREILRFAPSDKSWRAWLAEAREKAAAGQWREAIHVAFWAAVSRLEAEGLWRPDRARTPREYLRAIPAGNQARTPFAALTSKFEATWYGNRPASDTDFSQFVGELEKLGCR